MRVKYLLAGAALAVVALAVLGRSSWLQGAQDPALLRSTARIALVDMKKALAADADFNRKLGLLRREVKESEQKLIARKDAIKNALSALDNDEGKNANEAEALEKFELDRQALLEDFTRQKQDFMEREARIYAETRGVVATIVATYAEQHGIDLVLPLNVEPIDANDLHEVMGQLSQRVVYHHKLDITDEIVRRTNAK